MTITLPVFSCGAALGLGLVGSVASRRSGGHRPRATTRVRRLQENWARRAPLYALAAALGVAAGALTGWPVAALITAGAVVGIPALLSRVAGERSIAKVEAVATWTEMLQSTLAASAGLSQAIIATAPLSPLPIRDAATRLAGQLSAGQHPRDALVEFAEVLDDPSADQVVCALLLATSSRAQRMGDLLSALADSTREEVALRLRIETGRASVRSGVRTVVIFSIAFAAGLAMLARPYLHPFGTPTGQLVLGAVGSLYAAGLTLMVSMSRPPAPVRLLGERVEER